MLARALAIAAILLAGTSCVSLHPPDGALKCAPPPHQCPTDYSCTDGFCYVNGHVFDLSVAIAPEDLAVPAPADLAQLADLAMSVPPVIDDTFPGPGLDGAIWSINGDVTVVDDIGSDGKAAQVDAVAGGLNSFESGVLVLSGDFTLRARLRTTGITSASSVAFGLRGSHDAAFLIPLAQPAAWQLIIEGAVTAPSGTFAVSSTYADFEIRRVGTTVTMSIGGTSLHSFSSAPLAGDRIKASISGAGAILVDRVTLTGGG